AREVGHTKGVPAAEPFQSAGSAAEQQQARDQEQAEEGQRQRQRRPGRPEGQGRRGRGARAGNGGLGPPGGGPARGLGLMAAARRAFVADGAEGNWSIQQKYFPRFVAIVDFIHVLSYVFAAALAGRPFAEGWAVYQEWIGWVWQGKVEPLLQALRQ